MLKCLSPPSADGQKFSSLLYSTALYVHDQSHLNPFSVIASGFLYLNVKKIPSFHDLITTKGQVDETRGCRSATKVEKSAWKFTTWLYSETCKQVSVTDLEDLEDIHGRSSKDSKC